MSKHQRIGLVAALWAFVIVAVSAAGGVGLAKNSATAAQYQYGANGKKVTICHKGKVTITISKSALPAHQAHGDTTTGPCPAKKKKNKKAEAKKAEKAKGKTEDKTKDTATDKAEAKDEKEKPKADAKVEKAESKADKAESKAEAKVEKTKSDDSHGKSDEDHGKSDKDHGKEPAGDSGSNGSKGKKK